MTVLLDTHALYWWATDPARMSVAAMRAIEGADDLAVAAVTWFELAWLLRSGRLGSTAPIRSVITSLARDIRTVPLTPSIAIAAAELPNPFPRDPSDRQIFATAVEHGWSLVTKDRRLHAHDPGGTVVLW
jgi:PIN domain nuclease of toxin-antitoxin system